MGKTKELLLIQLAHAKQAIERARNNRYSDIKKQNYQNMLLALFEKVEATVNLGLDSFSDDTEIYDGPKKHLDFIFKSLEFLDNSTLNQIPYEIVACLEYAMDDWLEPKDKYIIVTSLINDVAGFSYERKLAIDDQLYNDIKAKYPEIDFDYRLVQINLPRAFARDYLATVVLYHELGHFIDHKYSLILKLYYTVVYKIYYNLFAPEKLDEIKIYLPDFSDYIDNPSRADWSLALHYLTVNLTHLREYFCDLFAAQYISDSSNLYVSYLSEGSNVYSGTHPSSTNRKKVVDDYQQGVPNVVIELVNEALLSSGKPLLEKKYELPSVSDFLNLIPPVISNAKQLHGVLNSAWQVWLMEREKMLSRLNTDDNSKCYAAINNLVEKAIGNFITIKEWNKAADDNTVAPTQTPPYADPRRRRLIKNYGTLNKQDIINVRKSHELVIRPLLSEDQIGEVGIDFRLGYDFLVSVQGRDAFINASKNEWVDRGTQHNVKHFFQSTRRQPGETFILHPHQTVLAVTLEYVKLPGDCLLELVMRSSYARLGITINTIAQPGYSGCLNLELTNNNNNPINLAVGARIIQGILHRVSRPSQYFRSARKYVCQVRPEPSAVINDKDLDTLNELWRQNNNQTI